MLIEISKRLLKDNITYAKSLFKATKEISVREAKIEDLTKALEDRMSEVQLIEEQSSLQTLNESLVEKLQKQQEELHQTQSQLKDARDQADLLEFRVLELEEERQLIFYPSLS